MLRELKNIIGIFLLLFIQSSHALEATLDNGDKVDLRSDGTWVLIEAPKPLSGASQSSEIIELDNRITNKLAILESLRLTKIRISNDCANNPWGKEGKRISQEVSTAVQDSLDSMAPGVIFEFTPGINKCAHDKIESELSTINWQVAQLNKDKESHFTFLKKVVQEDAQTLGYDLIITKSSIGPKARLLMSNKNNSGELEIEIVAKNISLSKLVNINLMDAQCSDGIEPICWYDFRGQLTDSYGNNLNPAVQNVHWISKQRLYPGEIIKFTVTGDRPVTKDGTFNLVINGIKLSGKALRAN